MRASPSLLLIAVLALSACDKITGEGERKEQNASSVGFACRVSFKAPEECMKENEALSPTAILKGWKEADKEINDSKLDPLMKKNNPALMKPAATPTPAPVSAPVAASAVAETPAAGKNGKAASKTKPAAH